MRSGQIHLSNVFISVLILTANAFAAPSVTGVSGTLSNGNSIAITGSSFTAKPTAGPIIWDTFENGVVGAQSEEQNAIIGDWDTGQGSSFPRYSSSRVRTGTKSSYHSFRLGVSSNVSLAKNGTFPNIYLDYWVFATYLQTPSRNWKLWRAYGSNDDYQVNYATYCPANNNAVVTCYAGACGVNINSWGDVFSKWGRWVHIQAVLKESSSGVADGRLRHYIDGVLLTDVARQTRCSTAHWNQVRVGHDWEYDALAECASSTGGDVYIDDVYLDNSLARVEIGSASTYAASTHREVQIPLTWAAAGNSILASVNTGTFSNGDSVWVYVADVNGDPNPTGYGPFTISGQIAGDTQNPVVTITNPTNMPTWNNGVTLTVNISGTASDNVGIGSVTWACPTSTPSSGTASTSNNFSNWSFNITQLGAVTNNITVSIVDSSGNTSTDTITIYRDSCVTINPTGCTSQAACDSVIGVNHWYDGLCHADLQGLTCSTTHPELCDETGCAALTPEGNWCTYGGTYCSTGTCPAPPTYQVRQSTGTIRQGSGSIRQIH